MTSRTWKLSKKLLHRAERKKKSTLDGRELNKAVLFVKRDSGDVDGIHNNTRGGDCPAVLENPIERVH